MGLTLSVMLFRFLTRLLLGLCRHNLWQGTYSAASPNSVKRERYFNWNSAINMDPFDTSTLYFGSQFVHKSTDKGLTWTIISGDLTTNDKEKQQQGESGGLTMDATGAENHTTILVIEPSEVEKDLLWTGSDDGRVHVTKMEVEPG